MLARASAYMRGLQFQFSNQGVSSLKYPSLRGSLSSEAKVCLFLFEFSPLLVSRPVSAGPLSNPSNHCTAAQMPQPTKNNRISSALKGHDAKQGEKKKVAMVGAFKVAFIRLNRQGAMSLRTLRPQVAAIEPPQRVRASCEEHARTVMLQ